MLNLNSVAMLRVPSSSQYPPRLWYSSHNIEDILQKSPRGLFMCALKRKTGTPCDS